MNVLGVLTGVLVTFLSAAWLRAEDDVMVGSFYDRVFARLEDASESLSVYHPLKYVGYSRLEEDIFISYGADNRRRLEHIQEKVDPRGVFTSVGLCRGGLKVRQKDGSVGEGNLIGLRGAPG